MVCEKCGASIDPEDVYCRNCMSVINRGKYPLHRDIPVTGYCAVMQRNMEVYFIPLMDGSYAFNGCDHYHPCEECKNCSVRRTEQLRKIKPELNIR